MIRNIFLSYRRDDSRGYTNAIYTLLELHYPKESIFMDVDTLVPGTDFVNALEKAVESCDIFLAVIGTSWVDVRDEKGQRRLDNPEDFVRIEVAHALERGIPVIPVLVNGAQMPSSEKLPDDLKDLARRHAFSIGDRLRLDVQRLIEVLDKTFEQLESDSTGNAKEKETVSGARVGAESALKNEEEHLFEKRDEDQGRAKKEVKGTINILRKESLKDTEEQQALLNQKPAFKARHKTKSADQSVPAARKNIPVWVWIGGVVVVAALGYGIFSGFPSFRRQTTSATEAAQAVLRSTPARTQTASPIETDSQPAITPTAKNSMTPTPEPLAGAESINPINSSVMVYVPSGEFIMGNDTGKPNESPEHSVYLDGFWIDKTEVTMGLYLLCVEDGSCHIPESQEHRLTDDALANHPLVDITWKQANSYCHWAGGRLPTEAEWEKAARGTDGRIYPWGDEIDDGRANINNRLGGTSEVGSFPEGSSPYGLLDMAGNAAEYVADWYAAGYYLTSPSSNPAGPELGLERVIKGGSWISDGNSSTATWRGMVFPETNDQVVGSGYGFRCAVSE